MAKVSDDQIAQWAAVYSPRIPGNFFTAMTYRESGGNPDSTMHESNGTISKGLLQLNDEEAANVGEKGANLYDPETNVRVAAKVFEKRLDSLLSAGSVSLDQAVPAVWYFLAFAHNAGLGKALEYLKEVGGLYWDQVKAKHSTFSTIAKGYADYIGDKASGSPFVSALASVSDFVISDQGEEIGVGLVLAGLAVAFYLWRKK